MARISIFAFLVTCKFYTDVNATNNDWSITCNSDEVIRATMAS
jgi:hypothetical protein